MKPPAVYGAISRVASHFAKAGLAKAATNAVEGYNYRSIDDVMDALSPLLARHRLCVLPKVIERLVSKHRSPTGEILQRVTLKVAFTLSSARDGSTHVVEAYGEALDPSDKATAKAMSAAYKGAMVLVFCMPVRGGDDADSSSHTTRPESHEAEPIQGWEQWTRDVVDIVALCESDDAISLVQSRNRALLKALGRERPDLYREVGTSFVERRSTLKARTVLPKVVSKEISVSSVES